MTKNSFNTKKLRTTALSLFIFTSFLPHAVLGMEKEDDKPVSLLKFHEEKGEDVSPISDDFVQDLKAKLKLQNFDHKFVEEKKEELTAEQETSKKLIEAVSKFYESYVPELKDLLAKDPNFMDHNRSEAKRSRIRVKGGSQETKNKTSSSTVDSKPHNGIKDPSISVKYVELRYFNENSTTKVIDTCTLWTTYSASTTDFAATALEEKPYISLPLTSKAFTFFITQIKGTHRDFNARLEYKDKTGKHASTRAQTGTHSARCGIESESLSRGLNEFLVTITRLWPFCFEEHTRYSLDFFK
jgi:hypothetical protein